MTRTLACCVIVASLCLAASAGANPGTISGYVRNTAGVPQMGATVEVFGSLGQTQVAYTDTKGFFRLTGLTAGTYNVDVSAPSFLRTLRQDVVLATGASKVVNVTLKTLFEAINMLAPLKKSDSDDDSWKWTLRSTANRPVLRFDDDTTIIVETAGDEGQPLKATLAMMAGAASEGYGSASDLGTAFNVEQSLFHTGTLGFFGDLGYGSGTPDGIIRASYVHRNSNGWSPSVALTVRRFSAPDTVPRGGALDAISMSYSDGFSVGNLMDVKVGGEGQAIEFLGREVNAFRPSATADLHLGQNTILEYRYATSEPDTRASKGFDSAPADLSETAPHMSMVDGTPSLENAHHHELSLSERLGVNKLQLAYYNDRVKDPALLGVGDIDIATGDILPDIYSGTFSYNGGELQAQGVRFVAQRKLSSNLTATLDYGYGGVLELQHPGVNWSEVRGSFDHAWRHSAALKLNGKVPRCKTTWIASYRWTSGQALDPVDMFNASAGQTDPFFNLFIRQPLPHFHGMPGNMEALIDVRNLLAQGYVPVVGPDGSTVYLVQSARSVRGGLAFSF